MPSVEQSIRARQAKVPKLNWNRLRFIGSLRVLILSYIVGLVAALPNLIGTELREHISNPTFLWLLILFVSGFGLAYLFYELFCPPVLKKFENLPDFYEHQLTIKKLQQEAYPADPFDADLLHVASQYYADQGRRPPARYLTLAFYLVGFAAFLFLHLVLYKAIRVDGLTAKPVRPSELTRLATFPVHFPFNARGDADMWTQGIQLSDSQRDLLRRLMIGLVPCVSKTHEGKVRLRIVGYASSAEFQKGRGPDAKTALLNTKTANLRSKAVSTYLEKIRKELKVESGIEIQNWEWKRFEDMAHSRPYNDRPEGVQGDNESEFFNRVVEIQMLDAGACDFIFPDRKTPQKRPPSSSTERPVRPLRALQAFDQSPGPSDD